MRASLLLRFVRTAARPLASYDPSNSALVFRSKTTGQLIFETILYKLCSFKAVVLVASSTLQSDIPIVSPLARLLCRHSVFPFFVSGESMRDCLTVSRGLYDQAGVTCILDHNVEEKDTEEAWDLNLKNKLSLIEELRRHDGHIVKFVPLKSTALLSPSMLENMTSFMEKQSSGSINDADLIAALSNRDRELLETGIKRLEALCAAAERSDIAILLDAEQTSRQPAIEVIARRLSSSFNTQGRVRLYNTYQCYLKRTAAAIDRDMKEAQANGYTFAVKLVRGAYMRTERARAATLGYADPVHLTKAATDATYDAAVTSLLEHVPQRGASLLVATHSRKSVDHAVSEMRRLGIEPSCPLVSFGSIMGMSDHISNALGLAGYNSSKLVSFGTFENVLPWLCRRLDENGDLFGAMQGERQLYAKELKRRILH